jgi:acetoin utilization protein AcuB
MLTAHDLMTEDPTTISMNATVHRAVTLLQRLDVRHLPVVDPDGALVGMLSDRNVGGLAFPEVLGSVYFRRVQTALNASVSSIMSRNVLSVGLEADVAEIIELMLDRNVGAVASWPVLSATWTSCVKCPCARTIPTSSRRPAARRWLLVDNVSSAKACSRPRHRMSARR